MMDVRFLKGSKEQYNSIDPKDKYTFYLIGETGEDDYSELYLGSLLLNSGDAITKLEKQLGTLSSLTTTTKSSLVEAVNELDKELGNLGSLSTSTKTDLVGAINELKTAITAEEVTLTDSTPDEVAKRYTLKQGDRQVGTIDIPKDMVVSNAEIKVLSSQDEQEHEAGTYIVLTIANDEKSQIWLNAKELVDTYTADTSETTTVTIDKYKIKVEVKDLGVSTAKIADDAVTEAKIADELLTKINKEDTLETGKTTDGSVAFNGTDVQVKGWEDLTSKISEIETQLTWNVLTSDISMPISESSIKSLSEIKNHNFGTLGMGSDYIDETTKVTWTGTTGKVSGKIKYKAGAPGFSGDEANGNYFPVILNSWYKDKNITVKGSNTKTEKDTDWLICLNKIHAGDNKLSFSLGEKLIAEFDFTGAEFEEAQ